MKTQRTTFASVRGKLSLSLFIVLLSLRLFTITIFAQESPPTTAPTSVFSSRGGQFNHGWNYFKLEVEGCSLKNVFDEIQADGGGALLANKIWKMEDGKWKIYSVDDTAIETTKVDSDATFAFNSNQKFFFDMTADVCKENDPAREAQIGQIREGSRAGESFLDKLLGVPKDFWNGLLSVVGFANAVPGPLADLNQPLKSLTVLGKSVLGETFVSGILNVGLLSFNGQVGSINSIGTLKLQSTNVAPIELSGGLISIDQKGNLSVKSGQILGNESFRGRVKLPPGETKVRVDKTWDTPPSSVLATPSYTVAISVKDISQKGFSIEVTNPSPKDEEISWLALW